MDEIERLKQLEELYTRISELENKELMNKAEHEEVGRLHARIRQLERFAPK